jgi:hypothetical protein
MAIGRIVVFVSLILFATTLTAHAHQPLTTYDAFPVQVHQVEFESGLHYINYPGGDEAFHLDIELNYGLINNLDLGVEVPFVFWRPDHGNSADVMGDVVVKSKLLFMKGREGNPISLAFQPFIKLPTADEKRYPLSTGEPDLGFVLIGTRNLQPIMAHLNIGYTFVNNPAGQNYDNVFGFKIGVEYLKDPTYQVVGELTGETNRAPNADDLIAVLVGTRYVWMKDLTFDTGFSLGLSNSSPDYRALFGITTRF